MLLHALAFTLTTQAAGQKWIDQTFIGGVTFSAPVALKKLDTSKIEKLKDQPQMDIWTGKDLSATYFMETFKPPMGPKDSTASILSGFLSGLMNTQKGDIDGERNLLLQGWPGIALTVVGPNGLTIATRCYFVNGSVLEASCAFATAAPRPASCDQFLNSVHLPKDGALKAAGPTLSRFPLGDGGMTVLFPAQPDKSDFTANAFGTKVPTHTYGSEYCFRIFAATYFNLPSTVNDPSDSDVAKTLAKLADEASQELEGSKISEKEITLGGEKGLLREVSMEHGFVGSLALVYHKRQCVMMMIVGPKGYRDPETVDAFLKSLQFGQ